MMEKIDGVDVILVGTHTMDDSFVEATAKYLGSAYAIALSALVWLWFAASLKSSVAIAAWLFYCCLLAVMTLVHAESDIWKWVFAVFPYEYEIRMIMQSVVVCRDHLAILNAFAAIVATASSVSTASRPGPRAEPAAGAEPPHEGSSEPPSDSGLTTRVAEHQHHHTNTLTTNANTVHGPVGNTIYNYHYNGTFQDCHLLAPGHNHGIDMEDDVNKMLEDKFFSYD